MKKIMLFAIAGIILVCIASTSMVQAMQHRAQGDTTIAPGQPSAVLSAFNQKVFHDLRVELDNPDFKENLNIQELRGAVMAQAGGTAGGGAAGGGGGVSSGGGAGGGTSSGISRSGSGRSKMREYNAKNKKAAEEEEEGWPQEEYPKGEWPKGEWPKGEWGDAEYPED